MQNHWNGAAKYGVSTILSTVPHTVMTSIHCYYDLIFHCFYFLQHLFLVLLPVQQNSREQIDLVACILLCQKSVILSLYFLCKRYPAAALLSPTSFLKKPHAKISCCKVCYCYLILYIVTYIIESHHKKLSFVVTDPWYIDGMKGFSVDKVTFILAGSNNANLRPIDATNYSWEPSPSVKTALVFVDDSCSCWPLYEHALLGG